MQPFANSYWIDGMFRCSHLLIAMGLMICLDAVLMVAIGLIVWLDTSLVVAIRLMVCLDAALIVAIGLMMFRCGFHSSRWMHGCHV